jgi:hypothetical protein
MFFHLHSLNLRAAISPMKKEQSREMLNTLHSRANCLSLRISPDDITMDNINHGRNDNTCE